MRTSGVRSGVLSWLGVFGMALVLAAGAAGAAAQAPAQPEASADATVESLFADFVHYARLGRFSAAEGFAKALLAHPDLDPVKVLEAAEQDRASVDTLLILIKNSSIGPSAAKVLELIEQGEILRRKDPARIRANIAKLGGSPQQEYLATRHLAESGEYAVPGMIAALLDPARAELRQRVITALPQIGKPAVQPLAQALQMEDDDARLHVIWALGEIGYPQAVPYLRRLMINTELPGSTHQAATAAIARIEQVSGRPCAGEPAAQLFELGERYYDEASAVRADPRLPMANVWYWDAGQQALQAVEVPTRIFGQVMAMRCAEQALLIEADRTDAIALWLAANVRRESRLGFDVESGDPDEAGDEVDPTRPEVFPRALYFTQAAGPRYAHLVLARAIADQDAAVALGAIEALRLTAGESSLIGTEDYKQPLVQALRFPDLLVRIRAALALGAALPKSGFSGYDQVVPVLGLALRQSGQRQVLVVDADQQNLNRVMGELRDSDTAVVGETSFYAAMQRARTEFEALSAVYLSTDLQDPPLAVALDELRSELLFAKTPVVILVKPQQFVVAEEIAPDSPYVERIDAAADGADLQERWERIVERTGERDIDADLALSIALQTADTVRQLAADGRTVLDPMQATPALIAALSSPSEELQVAACGALALLQSEPAQRAVAHVALDEANTKSLRVAAFSALARSARGFGNLLEAEPVSRLLVMAKEDGDLVIRTSASEALGALNLATNQASEIIRGYHRR